MVQPCQSCHLTFIVSFIGTTTMSGPTIEQLAKALCPPDKPYKCLPSGMCYGPDSFCHNGDPMWCFPPEMAQDLKAQLGWCLKPEVKNSSLLLDPSCRFACKVKFGTLDNDSGVQDNNQTWMIASVLLAIFLIISLIPHLVRCVKGKKMSTRASTRAAQNTGEDIPLSGVKDLSAEQEHITIDNVDTRQSDRDIRRPMLQDRNIPESVQLIPQQHDDSTVNSYGVQRNCQPSNSSSDTSVSTSSSSTAARDDSGNASETDSPLVQTNHNTGTAESLTQRERRPDLVFHTNPSSPDIAGTVSCVTSLTLYARD